MNKTNYVVKTVLRYTTPLALFHIPFLLKFTYLIKLKRKVVLLHMYVHVVRIVMRDKKNRIAV